MIDFKITIDDRFPKVAETMEKAGYVSLLHAAPEIIDFAREKLLAYAAEHAAALPPDFRHHYLLAAEGLAEAAGDNQLPDGTVVIGIDLSQLRALRVALEIGITRTVQLAGFWASRKAKPKAAAFDAEFSRLVKTFENLLASGTTDGRFVGEWESQLLNRYPH